MPLQDWIHRLEEGGGARIVKRMAAVLAFAVVAAAYNWLAPQGFLTQEAMESGQLARNLAQGKGYTTDSIKPLDLYLLDKASPGAARHALENGVPELAQPPVYPAVLAGLMRVARFDFTARDYWFYQPELWIGVFNQILFFVAALLLFSIGRRLFDVRVAWLAAVIFAGTELYWRFCLSGLSTILLAVIFLAMIRAMIESERNVWWAAAAGALAGVGTMTRYSFGWALVPAMIFCAVSAKKTWGRAMVLSFLAFAIVCAPWLARNRALTGSTFGSSVYALVDGTPPFPGDQLERALNPEPGFKQMRLSFIKMKMFTNLGRIVGAELPTMGGNWLCAFFLAGLLIQFRSPLLGRLRWFLVGTLVVWAMAEAFGRTGMSEDSPTLNSENLLVLAAPLLFVYGAGFFYTLTDQLNLLTGDLRAAAVVLFTVVMCLPLALTLFAPPEIPVNSPYSAKWLQTTARMMNEKDKELMMSDIPWGIAWYGERRCLLLTREAGEEFYKANAIKPVQALYLTQRTTDRPLLTEITGATNSWGRFYWDCWAHGEVPSGFPLRKAPLNYLPAQMLLSDHDRWSNRKENAPAQ